MTNEVRFMCGILLLFTFALQVTGLSVLVPFLVYIVLLGVIWGAARYERSIRLIRIVPSWEGRWRVDQKALDGFINRNAE